jgi:hypothetical protein
LDRFDGGDEETTVNVYVTVNGYPTRVTGNSCFPILVHLKTDRGQPYGSERRCCNHCGIMIWGMSAPPHVDNWSDWRACLDNCGKPVKS